MLGALIIQTMSTTILTQQRAGRADAGREGGGRRGGVLAPGAAVP
jgi:hypothetical protein